METIAILGGGSWGTALALVLSRNHPELPVSLWVHDPELARTMRERRENDVYLPGFKLPATIRVTNDVAEAVAGVTLLAGVMPSAHARQVYTAALAGLDEMPAFVSATKGIETGTLARMSQVIEQVAAARFSLPARIAALSGPSFALEVARGDPVAVVAASRDRALAQRAQEIFSGPSFRVYTSDDLVGVELGGAVKNPIALAVGIAVGMGLGDNTRAMLITRGLAEIARLGAALGADQHTFAGLAGMGDLVATCSSPLSRNRSFGEKLGLGIPLADIVANTKQVAEGVTSSKSVLELAAAHSVEMPITEVVAAVVYDGLDVGQAALMLASRTAKPERYGV